MTKNQITSTTPSVKNLKLQTQKCKMLQILIWLYLWPSS